MDPEFTRRTKAIVDDALGGLAGPPAPAGRPQYFFVVSRGTRFIINVALAPEPSLDLDELLPAIYDFIEARSLLEDGNIYLTRLGDVSILIEPSGSAVLAKAFDGPVVRAHYKEFHRNVREIEKEFPELGGWDGRQRSLPDRFRERLQSVLGPRPPAVAAPPSAADATPAPGPAPVAPAAPAGKPGGADRPEPDVQDCERKMREWYRSGLRIDRLKEALHKDWATLVRAFDEYETGLAELERLEAELEHLEGLGFDDEAARLRALRNDPANLGQMESGLRALARRVGEKYTIRLPVPDRRRLAESIRSLPLGIPSTLWGIPLERLIDEFLAADRGVASDGSVVVWLRGGWYRADPASPEFLEQISGLVRTQPEMLPAGIEAERLRKLMDLAGGPEGR
ncbi:MAG: hypothetical protein FJ149_04175 [Euryarchaeota archaeon]|nr:hypothetical protein [Euryarchaeota archaeon]